MKKIRKGLLVASLLGVGALSVGLFGACKKELKVKLVFDEKGGVSVADKELKVGTTYTLPIPTYEGYSFEGWYTTPDYTGEPVSEVKVTKGQTYYAKWIKVYTVTLDLNGGSSEKGTTVIVKQGAKLYEALAEYEPTKSGLVFGAWFNGNNELSKEATATADLNLQARFKVAYTVEIYKEKLDGSGYAQESFVDYAYPETNFVSEHKVDGFKEFAHQNTVVEKKLSANASENVFKHYYNREEYTVSFVPKYPNGEAGTAQRIKDKYEAQIEVPFNFEYEGYCLIGWSSVPNGEVEVKANYIDSVLYNKDANFSVEKLTVKETTTYYGVWQKGYTDMFGGTDTVFVIDEDADTQVSYLARGGYFFKGTYNKKRNEFRFTELAEDIIGRLYDNEKFILYSSARAEAVYKLYVMGADSPLVATTTVQFGTYNEITYREAGLATSEGTYVIEDGYYVASFTSGAYEGKTMYLSTSKAQLNGQVENIFQVRNEKEVALGTLEWVKVVDGVLDFDASYNVTLNGFGTATLTSTNGTSTLSYSYDEDKNLLRLRGSSSGESVCRVVELNGKKGFADYYEDFDKTYDIVKGVETLTLDGSYKAVYKNGNTSVEGYYTTRTSVFGGTIVSMSVDNGTGYAFMITEKTSNDTVTYVTEKKGYGYAEFYYILSAEELYYAPMLVLNETEEGTASVYGYTSSSEYVKVSTGTYTLDSETGRYTYVASYNDYETQAITSPYDMTDVASFVFGIDEKTYSISVNFWFSWTSETNGEEVLAETYTSDNYGELILVGGFAYYSEILDNVFGVYTKDEYDVVTVTANGVSYYFELTGNKFSKLKDNERPRDLYLIKPDGKFTHAEYLSLDGKGGATYVILQLDNNGNEISRTTYVGTVEIVNESTLSIAPIYLFKSNEKTFKFISVFSNQSLGTEYFSPFNTEYQGKYISTTDGILELDGFSFIANYTTRDGVMLENCLYTVEDGAVIITIDGVVRYFDIDTKNETFSLRGVEYGTYAVTKNQIFDGVYIELDGHGKAVAFKYVDDERVDIDVSASYIKNGEDIVITYLDGSKTVTLDGEIVGEAFMLRNSKAVQTYIDKTYWCVLTLDDVGNAIRYTSDGKTENGKYTLITSNLLYFINNKSTDACIYKYSVTNGEGEIVLCELTATSYYTTELESLYFSEYGFAIFNGEKQYYYEKVNGESVVMWRLAEDGDDAKDINEYGFVKEVFGTLDAEKEYNDKTYYRYYGSAIKFVREEATKSQYPFQVGEVKSPLTDLYFKPTGAMEFSVTGQVTWNNKTVDCVVVREIVDGKIEMFVAIYMNVGYYRFDIEASYNGNSLDTEAVNTYKVKSMIWVIDLYSYVYLQTYYNYYLMDYYYGSSLLDGYANDMGYAVIHRIYDVEGNAVVDGHYLTGEFLEGSKMYDTTGAIIAFDKAELISSEDLMTHEAIMEAEDGYTYHIYFQLGYQSAFGMFGYYVNAFTREETFETDDGYTVVIERRLASDGGNITVGANYKVKIIKDGVTTDLNSFGSWVLLKGSTYYIESIYAEEDLDDDGNPLDDAEPIKQIYYGVICTSSTDGSLDQDSKVPAPYVSVQLIIEEAHTYYSEDGKSWATIIPSFGVTLFAYGSSDDEMENFSFAVAEENTYDEATQTYTVKLFKKFYKVKIVEIDEETYITIEVESAE